MLNPKTIDNIVWYIPFKRLRNSVRDYLKEVIRILNNTQYYMDRGRYSQHRVRRMMAVQECVKYLEDHDARNITMLSTAFEELKYVFENEIELNGLFLEFGVYRGGTLNYMSNLKKDQIFYGFDSFEGLPEFWQPGFVKGQFNLNGELPTVNDNVKLIKGWFNESLPTFCKENNEDVAFLHIDCDLYSSTKIIFDNLKDRIKPGTVITFDEYFNYYAWKEHEYKAFQEFVKEKNVKYKYISSNSYTSCSVKILAIEQSRAEQSRAEQSRAEQSRADRKIA